MRGTWWTAVDDTFSVFLWQQRVHLANRVKQLRAERGLSQVKLAEITLLHDNTINRLENPEMDSVTLSTLARIAWALDIPITSLLGGDDADRVS